MSRMYCFQIEVILTAVLPVSACTFVGRWCVYIWCWYVRSARSQFKSVQVIAAQSVGTDGLRSYDAGMWAVSIYYYYYEPFRRYAERLDRHVKSICLLNVVNQARNLN